MFTGSWFCSERRDQYPDPSSSWFFGTPDLPRHVRWWLFEQRLFLRLPVLTRGGGTVGLCNPVQVDVTQTL